MIRIQKYLLIIFIINICNALFCQEYSLELINSIYDEKDSLLQISFVIENHSGKKSVMRLSDNFCSTKQKGCYCSYGVASSDTLYYYGDYFYYLEKSELEYIVTDSNNDSLIHNISVRSNEREIKLKKKYQFKLIFCRLNMMPKIIVFPLFINHTKEYFYITVDSFVLEK